MSYDKRLAAIERRMFGTADLRIIIEREQEDGSTHPEQVIGPGVSFTREPSESARAFLRRAGCRDVSPPKRHPVGPRPP